MLEQGCAQTNQLDEELVELTSEISLKQKLIEELGKYFSNIMGRRTDYSPQPLII